MILQSLGRKDNKTECLVSKEMKLGSHIIDNVIINTIINITPPLVVRIVFLVASDGEGLNEGRRKMEEKDEEEEKEKEGEDDSYVDAVSREKNQYVTIDVYYFHIIHLSSW